MTTPGQAFDPIPENPWFTPEDLDRFAECLTGDSDRDQNCFRALFAGVAAVLAEPDLDKLLCRLIDHAIRTTSTERGVLMLTDEEGMLRIRHARDESGRDLGDRVSVSRAVPEAVMARGQPEVARVTGEGDVLELTHSVASMRLRQVICAPVSARGRSLGVLYVDSTMGGTPFSRSDVLLFHAQAGLIGMAIENHRMFGEIVEAQKLRDKLRVARSIQLRMLPESPAEFGRTLLAGFNDASDRVGGDYFDYFPIDTARLGLCVGDVSGHGIDSALVMSNVRAHLRSVLGMRRTLSGLFGLMNRALCQDLSNGMFVSLFVAIYDGEKGLLEYHNAGHTAPLLYHPGRDHFREIRATAPALGIIDDISAGPCPTVQIEPGEVLVCFTDGVTERHNREGELFGEDRVKQIVRSVVREGGGPEVVVDSLRARCEDHAGGLPSRDDVTVVAARL